MDHAAVRLIDRARVMETKPQPQGMIVWFTGLSGVGKTTLAKRVKAALGAKQRVQMLDGDEVRNTLSRDLGFSKEDRDTHVRRIGNAARIAARSGLVAICAVISPYASVRDEVRTLARHEGLRFVEVALTAPLEVLAQRDPKGLYAKARAGQLTQLTGVDDPYEAPRDPELRLDTSVVDEDACVESLMRVLG
jgi:adenylylsulfate kinase